MNRIALAALALAVVPAGPPSWGRPGARLAAARAHPQAQPGVPTDAPVRVPPALMVKIAEDRPSEPLALSKVSVEAVITGFIARTTTTLTFRNDYPRALEGELIFPLPEGATISGYALDIGGEMVDGVVVESHEARIAFEKEVRKGVDPGLVEWVKGNNFRTRVWPIPPRGSRTVRVEYVSDLVTEGSGEALTALYLLPLRFRKPIDDFAVEIAVVKGVARPEVRSGGLPRFSFERWEERDVARTTLRDVQPAEDLLIALPDVPRRNQVVETAPDGRTYFAIDDFPEVPSAAPPGRTRRVGLFWDASLSREGDHDRELGIVASWLRRVRDVDVDVVVFRNSIEPPRFFAVRNGDGRSLLDYIGGLVYDGGTDLAALRFPRSPRALATLPGGAADTAYDYHLLFSDGLSTLGDEPPRVPEAPVYALSGEAQANHPLLRHVADISGGDYLNLARLAAADAVATIGVPAFAFLSAECQPGTVADLTPSGSRPVHGRITVAGRLLASEARITLHYGASDAPTSRTYVVRRSDAVAGDLVARLWAGQRVAEMSAFPEKNHDELLRLGREFGIVTPGTSLVVLETVEQYLQYRIEPPKSRPRMHEEYVHLFQEKRADEKQARDEKLRSVAEMWGRRVQWWERQFKYPEGFRVKASVAEQVSGVRGGVAGGVLGGVVGGVVGGVPGRVAQEAPRSLAYTSPVLVSSDVAAAKAKGEAGPSSGPMITIKPWDPDTPYLRAMKAAGPKGAYTTYLAERREFGSSPAFYLDCADLLFRAGLREMALRVLTDVPELRLEEPRLLRVAAHRLQQAGELDLAVALFEKVLKMRPEEPQSLRDLALALGDRADAHRGRAGKADAAAAADYRRALGLLDRVVLGRWDGRFPEIEVIALEEANRIIAILARDGLPGPEGSPLGPELRKALDVDVRVVLTWDTDETDMDLWVVEPSDELCFYRNPLTTVGGMISRDFTQGYGPEEYLVRRALAGEYQVKANFYGSRSQTLTGPTTVQATVITNFSRPNEERRTLTLRLTEAKEVVDVGTVEFGKRPAQLVR